MLQHALLHSLLYSYHVGSDLLNNTMHFCFLRQCALISIPHSVDSQMITVIKDDSRFTVLASFHRTHLQNPLFFVPRALCGRQRSAVNFSILYGFCAFLLTGLVFKAHGINTLVSRHCACCRRSGTHLCKTLDGICKFVSTPIWNSATIYFSQASGRALNCKSKVFQFNNQALT